MSEVISLSVSVVAILAACAVLVLRWDYRLYTFRPLKFHCDAADPGGYFARGDHLAHSDCADVVQSAAIGMVRGPATLVARRCPSPHSNPSACYRRRSPAIWRAIT